MANDVKLLQHFTLSVIYWIHDVRTPALSVLEILWNDKGIEVKRPCQLFVRSIRMCIARWILHSAAVYSVYALTIATRYLFAPGMDNCRKERLKPWYGQTKLMLLLISCWFCALFKASECSVVPVVSSQNPSLSKNKVITMRLVCLCHRVWYRLYFQLHLFGVSLLSTFLKDGVIRAENKGKKHNHWCHAICRVVIIMQERHVKLKSRM